MEQYRVISHLGAGAYGSVWKAIHRASNEVVAIKKLKHKYRSLDECINLREVQSLLRLSDHPNVVKLKHCILQNDEFFFVFEHMDCNLQQLVKYKDTPFSEAEVRNWMFQILHAVEFMHRVGYFHRDLKPENLLVSKDVIKVADLGMAREVLAWPPYTSYVTSRWYRAPEVLLQSPRYGAAIDVWAVGAIMAELFTLRPLFPGASDVDQVHRICAVLGAPSPHTWTDGMKLAASLGFQFPPLPPTPLAQLIPNASPEAIDLVSAMCSWDPSRRPTAAQALQHPFFRVHKQRVASSVSGPCCQFGLKPTARAAVGKLGHTPGRVRSLEITPDSIARDDLLFNEGQWSYNRVVNCKTSTCPKHLVRI